MKSTKLLIAVVVLQSLILLGQWTGSGPLSPAHAQIPDSGAQLNSIRDELKSVNAKLDKLIETLESGRVQVKVAQPDDKQ